MGDSWPGKKRGTRTTIRNDTSCDVTGYDGNITVDYWPRLWPELCYKKKLSFGTYSQEKFSEMEPL